MTFIHCKISLGCNQYIVTLTSLFNLINTNVFYTSNDHRIKNREKVQEKQNSIQIVQHILPIFIIVSILVHFTILLQCDN